MKKLFHILLLSVLTGMVAGCSEDGGGDNGKGSAVVVTEAQTLYPQVSSSGAIKIEAQGTVSVESNTDWCSVSASGNTVTVAVAENRSIESRNATISITSSGETVKVDIVQRGIYFIIEDPESKLSYRAGYVMDIEIPGVSYPVTVVSFPDWLNVTIDNNNTLRVTTLEENTAMTPRTGNIMLSMLGYTKSLVIAQSYDMRSYDAFLGDYELSYNTSYSGTGTWGTKQISLVQLEKGATYAVKGILADESLGNIVMAYDAEAKGLSINGQIIHTDADGVDLWFLPMSANNYTSRSTDFGLKSVIDGDDWKSIRFADNGYVSTSSYITSVGFRLRWYKGSSNKGNYAPFPDAMTYWEIKKI